MKDATLATFLLPLLRLRISYEEHRKNEHKQIDHCIRRTLKDILPVYLGMGNTFE